MKSLRGTRADKLSGQKQIPVSFAEIIISERWKKSRGGVIEINKEQVQRRIKIIRYGVGGKC